jgi:hypothetical protein
VADRVIKNGQTQTSTEWLREQIAMETEGATSPAQSSPLTVEQEQEIERLAAADKFMRMRRVRELAPGWSEMTRIAYARTFAQLSVEFQAAADYCKRYRADDDIPEWLRANGAV